MRLTGAGARVGSSAEYLVLGLGNPGAEYEHTRHNVGADAIRLLAERHHGSFKVERGQRSHLAEVTISGVKIALGIPTTFMNESGAAVKPLLKRTGIADLQQLIVVHDELDLSPGLVKLKAGGGLAGHNGLRSISGVLGSQDFLRVRIGIGKPPSKEQGAQHVLKKLSRAARTEMEVSIAEAADAVELLVTAGLEAAMNQFN
ncbi:MAG: aminoacyl-tRNA hydrolase [Actinomycetota bacterium]